MDAAIKSLLPRHADKKACVRIPTSEGSHGILSLVITEASAIMPNKRRDVGDHISTRPSTGPRIAFGQDGYRSSGKRQPSTAFDS